MESILTSLPNLQIREKIRDDDLVDQLHHFVTVYMFALFGVIVGLKEYLGAPLDCWVKSPTWQHYQGHANSYCWSHKLYRYPQENNLSQGLPMLASILTNLRTLRLRSSVRTDDSIDQLHHYVTVFFFTILAGILVMKEFTGHPLDCWWEDIVWTHFHYHVSDYCWAHKLYRFPDLKNLSKVPYLLDDEHGGPLNATEAESSTVGEINFYRWVTVVFIVQALMFKLPNIIWSGANEYSGTQIEKMVSMIGDSSFKPKREKEVLFSSVAEYLETWLKINRKPFWFMKSRIGRQTKKILQHCMLCVGANTGNYLSNMYLVVKVLFVLNVVFQFAILSAFLEFSFWPYGPRALEIYAENERNVDSIHFPRVALCHFQVRGEGSWVQCLLTINMLLEKLFIVEWFWLLLLLIVTIYSLIAWLYKILSTVQSVKFVTKYLSILNEDGSTPQEGRRTVQTFVRDYLGNDGIFLLRILATNTNDVVMAEMICSVWRRYVTYENKVTYEEQVPKVKSEKSTDLEMEELQPSKVIGPAGDRKISENDDPVMTYSSVPAPKAVEDSLHIA
ncbi:innexin [Plakobranchus ocellatus]|uniref:Innexin n=1 Tax=Plakobranchus ocellatus TaxID=259542 RepID=A0AAV4DA97_9GAST|nr:innexin [Plakobranchus ocellatus]